MTSAASGADSDAENRGRDLELYLTASHPENVVITRYGREVVDFLERDKHFLKTENKIGWTKWILRDSFLRRMRSSQHPIKIANFLESYGEAALTAVKEDTKGFRVDTSSGTIEIIPIDKLAELEKIVYYHYWTERATGHSFEWEIEVQSRRKPVQVRLYVDAKDRGRFIGNGGFRVRALATRILNDIGVKASISIRKRAGGDESKLRLRFSE